MVGKPSYEELEERIKELEKQLVQHKQTRETLHAYKQIISTVGDLMSFLDQNYRYLAVNDAYLKAFPDKSREDIVGHTPPDLIGEKRFRTQIKPHLDRCLKGKIVHYQDQFEYPGRGKRYMDVSYYPIFSNDGIVLGIVHISRDITEHKRVEKEMQQSEHQLRLLSAQLLTAQENERKRISRELHDSIGNSLTAMKFALENLVRQSSHQGTGLNIKPLETVMIMLREAIQDIRRIQAGLRPSLLDDLGIVSTISWFCREFQKVYPGIRIQKQINIDDNDVPESLKVVVFRLLQEALNNAAKYAKADLVRVSIKEKTGMIEITVEDNGLGFDIEHIQSLKNSEEGFGLRSMQERTRLSGGSFTIESQKGAGTIVRASWQH